MQRETSNHRLSIVAAAKFHAALLTVAAILFLILALFYLPFIRGAATFYLFDFTYGWEPYIHFIQRQLAAHQWPLWNPYADCGVPQIAFMAPSPFYPLNWLFMLGKSFSQAMAANLVANQLLGGIGMFLLIASLGWGAGAGMAGALIYALSGIMFSAQNTYSLQATAAWFPFLLWAMNEIAQAVTSVELGLAFADACFFGYLMLSAGVPEIAGICLAAAVVVCLFINRGRARKRFKRFGLQMLALGATVLACAPQLLPLLEWVRLSPRAFGLSIAEVMRWSASWYDVLGIILGQPLGDLYDLTNQFRLLVLPEAQPYLASAFLGPTVLTMAGWGLADKTFRARFWLLAAAIAAVVFALGINSPIAVGLVKLTGLKLVRYPIKLMLFAVIPLVVLAARGLSFANQKHLRGSNHKLVVFWCGVLLTSVVVLAAVIVGQARAVGGPVEALRAVAWARVATAGCLAGIWGLITCLFAARLLIGKLTYNQFAACTTIFAVSQLCVCAWEFQSHPGPPDFFSESLWVTQLIEETAPPPVPGSFPRICTLYKEINAPRRLIDPRDVTASDYQYDRQMLVPPTPMDAQVGSTLYVTLGETRDHYLMKSYAWQQYKLGNDQPLYNYCRLTATGTVLSQQAAVNEQGELSEPLPLLDSRYFHVSGGNDKWNLRAYAVYQPLARAYFAKSVKWGAPHSDVVRFVAQSDRTAFDPAAMTVLEHNAPDEKGVALSTTDLDVAAAQVRFLADLPNSLSLRVYTPKQNYLVLCDEFYPGWHAAVDGKPAPIFRANGILRAVLVPAGQHTVRFDYEPESLKLGLRIALLALGLMVATTILLLMQRRERRASGGNSAGG